MTGQDRALLIFGCTAVVALLAGIVWGVYQSELTTRTALQNGYVQERTGWNGAPLWVKQVQK